MVDDDLYAKLGASSKKEAVHDAIKTIDKGLYPGAFCKIVSDISNRGEYCSIFHSDGAGTKSSLAYMYYKETGDPSVFEGVVKDAIVMNIDDVLCVGVTDNVFISNNLGRNSRYISGQIISIIIKEYERYCKELTEMGMNLLLCGGETADVGDLVRTLIIDASVFATIPKKDIIDASKIKSTDVIVGLASDGKSTYEKEYNSGIGCNGLTLARHGTLSHDYYKKYPEAFDPKLEEKYAFFGTHFLQDPIKDINLTVGQALLSPTRTYAPIISEVLKEIRSEIHGIIHNTGGGQLKSLNFGTGIKYVKNDLFKIPSVFNLIKESSGTSWKEMYSVFNMGHRMELFCDESIAKEIIEIANKYSVNSKIVGYCESSNSRKNLLAIESEYGKFEYS
ncbi:MAG: phosphoribosylformylglycinamidine cyclo-ligase [Candidatus Lokiarchaeota archaeon]|nr:phosphoribosylformylglycinamidine cyclo-ligase [Candidatus Lokiarchaeota archaeon]